MISLRRSRDVAANRALFARGLPGDPWVGDHHAFWIAVDTVTDEPVGFCSAVMLPGEPGAFLSSAAVFPKARGQRLQRRMIATRCAWARGNGATYALTYTLPDNWRSIGSLLAARFHVYTPAWAWAGKGMTYFVRDFSR